MHPNDSAEGEGDTSLQTALPDHCHCAIGNSWFNFTLQIAEKFCRDHRRHLQHKVCHNLHATTGCVPAVTDSSKAHAASKA